MRTGPDAAPAGPRGPLQVQVVVLAKEPRPGRVKTRLTPPFSPGQAADLAAAALVDTLAAAGAAPFAHRVLALDGSPRHWSPPGWTVLPQRGGSLDERIAAAFDDAYAMRRLPLLLIGMDTPQVTPSLLARCARRLLAPAVDGVLGPAADGGFWALGLRRPDPGLLLGVPMSTGRTGTAQWHRMRAAGLRVAALPRLTDVDTAATARLVAAGAPRTRFARALSRHDRRAA